MKKIIIAFVLMTGLVISGQERITLTTPIARPSIADYFVGSVLIQPQLTTPVIQPPRIEITLVKTGGEREVFIYPCTNACTAMNTDAEVQAAIVALNSTVNMATRTLNRRIMDFLIRDFPLRFSGGATVN